MTTVCTRFEVAPNGETELFLHAKPLIPEPMRRALMSMTPGNRLPPYLFGIARGFTAPQSADNHLPDPSMFIFSGLPCTEVFIVMRIV